MGLEIIGAGFGRTGTFSLKKALEQLGFGKCHTMMEVFKRKEQEAPFFTDAAALLHGDPEKVVDWDMVYGKYKAAVDFPTCCFYKQLLVKYPEAKVILTIRNPEKWYESVRKSIYAIRDPNSQIPMMKMAEELVWNGIFQGNFHDKQFAIKVYNDHIEEVKRTVPENRLLVFDTKQGWEPLCKFLNASLQTSPFPLVKDKADGPSSVKKLAEQLRGDKN